MLESEKIILNWLNNELEFEPKIKNITKEFSDGYNFADIFYKLNEINEDQLDEFNQDTSDKLLIKKNFILIKKYFLEKFDLEIRHEEFDEIINRVKSKAVIILYKLKNAIRLKEINFYNIKTSLTPETKAELNEKVRKIIDYEYFNDLYNEDILYDINPKEETKYEFTSNIKTVTFSDQVLFKNTYSKKFDESENKEKENDNNINYSTKMSSYLRTQSTDIMNKKTSKDSSFKLPNIFQNLGKSKTKKNMLLITDVNSPKPCKPKIMFGNGTSDIAEENTFKISKLTDNLFKLGINDFQFNFKHTLPVFNSRNINELNKVRKELQNKIRTIDEEKKQRSNKKNLQIRLYDVPEIDFRGNNNNNSKTINTDNIFSENKTASLVPIEKMKKYCKKWSIYCNQRKLEKKIKYFSNLIKNSNKIEEVKNNTFSDEEYLSTLNISDIDKINNILKIKIEKNKLNYPLMNKLILLIIDMVMEIFFYQEGKHSDIIDIETFTKFLELFIANKPMRERVDVEARMIKEKNKDTIDINVERLKLNAQGQYLKEDYKNYIGFWNSDIIMDKKFLGMKIDIKTLKEYLPSDYEPTESEIENLTLPLGKEENFLLGDLVLDLLDNKFPEKNVIKEKGKWDYIDYKLSFIGLPFCGKNFIAEEIKKKYPNMVIYSVNNILRQYVNEYKTITEPLENNPKFKSMKPNQIEQLKQEKENKLKEFEPKLKLIQPYLDSINNNLNNINKEDNPDNDKENKENSTTINIPSDELLLNILIYNIENDFPKISEEERNKEISNAQNQIYNLIKQKENLEKQINESKKANPKDEQNLANLDKEIEKEKNNTVKGFILVDFPSNIKQCNLLEHYLCGYVDVTSLPKTQKMKNIDKISNLFDFNFQPPENNKTKKAGIDYIINIITKDELVVNRFNKKKYDPLNDKIYSDYELSQEIITKDKKLMERLQDNVPYFTQEHFDFYRNQYNENISKIYTFYSQFGFSKNSIDFDSNINLINLENNNNNIMIKDINRTYQEINIENNKNIIESEEEKVSEFKAEEKIEKGKKGEKNIINKEQQMMINKENEIKDTIMNYITNLIQYIFKEKEEQDKQIFYKEHPEMVTVDQDDEEKDKIQFDPEFKVNEISGTNLPKKFKKENNPNLKQFHFVYENFDSFLSEMINLNIKYEKHIAKFIYLIKKQQNDIYSRLILIQKKYKDFLNLRSDKKKVISLYCQKYNSFFTEYPSAFNSVIAIDDFSEDIDKLNSALWSLINLKETVSIKELQEIKNSNFIEHELKKFYKMMKDLFLVETEKYLDVVNSILGLYHKKTEDASSSKRNSRKTLVNIKSNINNVNIMMRQSLKDIKKSKNKIRIINQKEDIFTDTIEILDDYTGDNDNDEFSNVYSQNKNHQNNLDYMINYNIQKIFDNCLNLILSQEAKIESTLKYIKELINPNLKKNPRAKKKLNESMGSSMISTFMQTKEGGTTNIDENLKKMIDTEKNKYKYRLCFLRSFVKRYFIIIGQSSKKVFLNIDNWIINSVSLQNEARKHVINKLKSLLKEKKLINEDKDINHIELDTFEALEGKTNKIYEKMNVDYLINDNFVNIIIKEIKDPDIKKKLRKNNKMIPKNYKIILPNENDVFDENKNSRPSDKFYEIDFSFNIWKFYELYNELKLFEIKNNVISQGMFYENFVKKYLYFKDNNLTKNNSDSIEDENKENNNQESKKLYKNYSKTNKTLNQDFDKEKSSPKNYPLICKALKTLSSKHIKKLFDLFQINIIHPPNEELISENKENNDYDKYIDILKIFTILSLMGTEVLTEKKEKIIMDDLKYKLVKNKYLSKNEFMKQKFWFENNFKFNESSLQSKKGSFFLPSKSPKKFIRQKTKNLTNTPYSSERKPNDEPRGFSIKDFLYAIWEDRKEHMINFIEFIDVLRISNYTKKIESEKDIYFDIIFGE